MKSVSNEPCAKHRSGTVLLTEWNGLANILIEIQQYANSIFTSADCFQLENCNLQTYGINMKQIWIYTGLSFTSKKFMKFV